MTQKVIALVGGWDPSGGAGVGLDIRVATAFRLHPAAVLTTWTAQTAWAMSRAEAVDEEKVRTQLNNVFDSFEIEAVKVGMIGGAANAVAVAHVLADRNFGGAVVVDPVLSASSGASALGDEGRSALIDELLPWTTVVTPNLPEAHALTGVEGDDDAAIRRMCERLAGMGARHVVVKGGHGPDAVESVDHWHDGRHLRRIAGPRIAGADVRGTGCAYATALASALALGGDMMHAVTTAKAFVTRYIEDSWAVGPVRLGAPPRPQNRRHDGEIKREGRGQP